MHAERVDGYNPLAVADAIERKRKVLEEGEGPVLLDTLTYRFSGHSPSDAMAYRTKEEMQMWQDQDSLKSFGAYLLENGHASEDQVAEIQAGCQNAHPEGVRSRRFPRRFHHGSMPTLTPSAR